MEHDCAFCTRGCLFVVFGKRLAKPPIDKRDGVVGFLEDEKKYSIYGVRFDLTGFQAEDGLILLLFDLSILTGKFYQRLTDNLNFPASRRPNRRKAIALEFTLNQLATSIRGYHRTIYHCIILCLYPHKRRRIQTRFLIIFSTRHIND